MNNRIKYTSTNSNGNNLTAARVYVNNVKIVELTPNKYNPLDYLQGLQYSKYNVELCDQLTSAMEKGQCSYEDSVLIKREVFPLIYK